MLAATPIREVLHSGRQENRCHEQMFPSSDQTWHEADGVLGRQAAGPRGLGLNRGVPPYRAALSPQPRSPGGPRREQQATPSPGVLDRQNSGVTRATLALGFVSGVSRFLFFWNPFPVHFLNGIPLPDTLNAALEQHSLLAVHFVGARKAGGRLAARAATSTGALGAPRRAACLQRATAWWRTVIAGCC